MLATSRRRLRVLADDRRTRALSVRGHRCRSTAADSLGARPSLPHVRSNCRSARARQATAPQARGYERAVACSRLDTSGSSCARRVSRCCACRRWPSKNFLVTIGDRNVGGLVSRDQMVGPWQVPVSDVAVAAADLRLRCGGRRDGDRRTPAGRGAGRAGFRTAGGRRGVTNILAADVSSLHDVRLSANWMAASGEPARMLRSTRR